MVEMAAGRNASRARAECNFRWLRRLAETVEGFLGSVKRGQRYATDIAQSCVLGTALVVHP
jgi:hypothetical protein